MVFVVAHLVQFCGQLISTHNVIGWRGVSPGPRSALVHDGSCAFVLLLLTPWHDQTPGWPIRYVSFGSSGQTQLLTSFTGTTQYTSHYLYASETVKS
jgi:hypothetical protein